MSVVKESYFLEDFSGKQSVHLRSAENVSLVITAKSSVAAVTVLGSETRISPGMGKIFNAIDDVRVKDVDHTLLMFKLEYRSADACQMHRIPETFQLSVDLSRALDLYSGWRMCARTDHTLNSACALIITKALVDLPKRRSALLKRAVGAIEDDLVRPIRINDLAHKCGASRRSLHSSFVQETGMTPHQFISHRRLKQVMFLIDQNAISLSEIAEETGFSDQSALTRCMKKRLGFTPSQYRKRLG